MFVYQRVPTVTISSYGSSRKGNSNWFGRKKKTQSLGTLNFQRVPHVPIAEVSGDPAGPRASFVHRWSPVASQSL